MARYRCTNFSCGLPPRFHEFEADVPRCPKCGTARAGTVHELTDVHFLVVGHGPLLGPYGAHHVACEPDRPHLTLHASEPFPASDHPEAVTCPKCRGTPAFQDFVKTVYPKLWLRLVAEKEGKKVTVDLGAKPGDCGCGN